ncbi:MAG: tRNA dihydrouridine synthase DusB [Bacteroidia bacterium]|nr:MAG: tRNA dihydrouridine synthase DusB [Bacteroidia bacterium]
MHIGDLDLGEQPLFLAPMEDITDPSFRYLCKKFGADVMYTEFISSDGLIRDGAKSVKKLDIFDYERPMGIQLYGHIVESMVEATHRAVEAQPEIIDINYGCPVRKIAIRGAGAGMLANIPLMMEMTRAIVEASPIPVTVKTRLGWDEQQKVIVEVAEQLQDQGIAALTIHGRTRAQMYKGSADWTLIGEVKNNPRMKIPVIGNGDITTPLEARAAFDRYGVDGIMIGRAAVGKPWLFRHVKHYLSTGELLDPPTVSEKVDMARLQFTKSLEVKSEPVGIYEMRRHLSNYFKGLPHFKEMRLKLLTTLVVEEIFSLLEEIREKYGDHTPEDPGSFWDK